MWIKYIILISLFGISCTRPTQEAVQVKIKLPEKLSYFQRKSELSVLTAQNCDSSDWDCSNVPATYDDVDCYAVFISGSESGFNQNSCSKTDGTNKIYFGPFKAVLSKNVEAQFELIPGKGRGVYLFGVKKAAGIINCEDISSLGPQSKYTRPILLGKVLNVDMSMALVKVNVPVASTLESTEYFDECVFSNNKSPNVTPTPIAQIGGCSAGSIDHQGLSWTVSDGEVVTGDHCNINEFIIPNGAIVSLQPGAPFQVYSRKIKIGGTLNGAGKGYLANSGPGVPNTAVQGAYHSGDGGVSTFGNSYGSYLVPTLLGDMGSGSTETPGGGAVSLTAIEKIEITNYSSINMIGVDGNAAGGSAGGVIKIKTPQIISLNDSYGYPAGLSLNVSGGRGGTSAGGGSGGRIYLASDSVPNSIYGSGQGGTGDGYNSNNLLNLNGSNGTFFKTSFNGGAGQLEIMSGGTSQKTIISDFSLVSQLKLSGGLFELQNGISYPTLVTNGADIVAKSGLSFAGSLTLNYGKLIVQESNVSFSNLIIGNGATLVAESSTAQYGNLTVQNGGKVSTFEPERGSNPIKKIYINATNINIQSGGLIDGIGRGYSSTFGPGASASSAGSHAGHGSGNSGSTAYGSSTDPNTYGSGGYGSSGDNPYYGYWNDGAGGGIIRINASNEIIIDGEIKSESKSMGCCISWHSGAGGSVFIKSNLISGSGVISASAGTFYSGGRGGGGRIALYYNSKTFTGTVSVDGYEVGTIHDAGGTSYGGAPSL